MLFETAVIHFVLFVNTGRKRLSSKLSGYARGVYWDGGVACDGFTGRIFKDGYGAALPLGVDADDADLSLQEWCDAFFAIFATATALVAAHATLMGASRAKHWSPHGRRRSAHVSV